MFYRLPGFLELLLPLGLFIGILMAYGRLYVESEMVILSACGVGPGQLARFTLVPALLVTLLVAGLALFLTPQGAARTEALLNDPRAMQGLQLLAAGRFQPRGDDGSVSYAAGVDTRAGELRQVFLYTPEDEQRDPGIASVTVARSGVVVRDASSGSRYLELSEGYRFTGQPGRADFTVVSFDRYGQRLPDQPTLGRSEPVDARPTMALLDSGGTGRAGGAALASVAGGNGAGRGAPGIEYEQDQSSAWTLCEACPGAAAAPGLSAAAGRFAHADSRG
jgi:lipopolysaccharide export system permease protein